MHAIICDWICKKHPKCQPKLHVASLTLKATHTPAHSRHIMIKYMAIDAWSGLCFHKQLFANPVTPCWCTTGHLEPLRGINKDACGAKLLPTTVSAYPVGCVCFVTYCMETQHCCLCTNGNYSPCTCPHHPLPPTRPYTCHS